MFMKYLKFKAFCCTVCKAVRIEDGIDPEEFESVGISRLLAHEDGKIVSPTHRPPSSPRITPGTHFC